jgi:hypothetical protein
MFKRSVLLQASTLRVKPSAVVLLLRTLHADRRAHTERAGRDRLRKQTFGRACGESDVGRAIAQIACACVGACQVHVCLSEGAEAEYARRGELQVRREADERGEEVPQDDCLRGM